MLVVRGPHSQQKTYHIKLNKNKKHIHKPNNSFGPTADQTNEVLSPRVAAGFVYTKVSKKKRDEVTIMRNFLFEYTKIRKLQYIFLIRTTLNLSACP